MEIRRTLCSNFSYKKKIVENSCQSGIESTPSDYCNCQYFLNHSEGGKVGDRVGLLERGGVSLTQGGDFCAWSGFSHVGGIYFQFIIW